MFDSDDDFGFDDAMLLGTGYALYRHGQDAQTAALKEALQDRDDETTEVNVHIHAGEDERGIAPVNALDFSTVDMPDDWEDYIGQEPLKRQLMVHIKSAQERKAPLPHVLLASGYPGVGKALPATMPVLTPEGWREIQSLRAGDQVTGRDGRPTTVLGVYPQGARQMYRITLSDGTQTTADGEHLWTVQTIKQRQSGRWQTLTTSQMMERGLTNSQGRPNFFLPMVAPAQHDTKIDHPIDPYLLGVLLANGHLKRSTPVVSTNDASIIDTATRLNPDLELVEYAKNTARRFAVRGRQKRINPVGTFLDDRGLRLGSREKFIPNECFTAPLVYRRFLLAGLMDCDGSVRRDRGSALYHTMSPKLASGVRTLVQSLGGTALVRDVGKRGYRVEINMTDNPFTLPRKADVWKPSTRGPSRSIVSIEEAAIEDATCIKVDAPDELFVIDNYVVTHNTTMARLIAKTMGKKIIELVPPFNIYTLVEAAKQLGDGDVLFIDEIHKLADSGARGAEILLKVLEDRVAYLPDGEVVPLKMITVIGATTDRDKLPETVVDRFKIKPYFQAYSLVELGRIAIDFAFRHRSEDYVENEMAFAISDACRGTPRIIEEMVLACRDLALAYGRNPTVPELLEFLEVEPDGLTRTHIHYLTAMRQYFERESKDGDIEYIIGEAAIMQILRETKQGIGRIERFLVERGLIDRTPRGRRLTNLGIARAEAFIAAGKGVTDVA